MTHPKIAIIDYGMGNTLSIANALKRLNAVVVITDNPDEIVQADGIILPGVGAFGKAMENLKNKGLDKLIRQYVLEDKKPFLGICLGMQLLAKSSLEDGFHEGIGIINARVLPLHNDVLRVPHVGWNNVLQTTSSSLFDAIPNDAHFYFDHSFYLQCEENDSITASTEYGSTITATYEHANIHAVQFHPEKSQQYGLRMLQNFLNTMTAKSLHA